MTNPFRRLNQGVASPPLHAATVIQEKQRPFGSVPQRPPHPARVPPQRSKARAQAGYGSAAQRMEEPNKVPNRWGTDSSSPLLITEEEDSALFAEKKLREYKRFLRAVAYLGENDLQNGTLPKGIDSGAIAEIFHLNEQELFALEAYGSPYKDQPDYRYYMGQCPRFRPFQSGWHALTSAITKLPSLGALGLGDLSLIRVERAESKLFGVLKSVAKAGGKLYVVHGFTVMQFGQKHLMSWSLMMSTHSGTKENYKRGLFSYRCPSGRYMNNFSVQGLLDGGEVLVLPGVVTEFVGIKVRRWMGEQVECAHLVEVEKGKLDPSGILIEDFKCNNVTEWGKTNGYYKKSSWF
jgi:hypothetical protein